jgi:hypothetical protein
MLTLQHGVVPIALRGELCVHQLECNRSDIDFHKTLTNSPVYRRVTVSNPAAYLVPFEVNINHSVRSGVHAACSSFLALLMSSLLML